MKSNRTIWGLTPAGVHDRFWAIQRVQTVRLGSNTAIADEAELYMLIDAEDLVLMDLSGVREQLRWSDAPLCSIMLLSDRSGDVHEVARSNGDGLLARVERRYSDAKAQTLAVTTSRQVAAAWAEAASRRAAWRAIQTLPGVSRRVRRSAQGGVYRLDVPGDDEACLRRVLKTWQTPWIGQQDLNRHGGGVWASDRSRIDPGALVKGPVWVGAGHRVGPEDCLVGPSILWDQPGAAEPLNGVAWSKLPRSSRVRKVRVQRRQRGARFVLKRAFDLVGATLILLLMLPLFPLIALMIWLEDGSPILFAHRRECAVGVQFPCLKFRTMRKDAEAIKEKLAQANQVDGPQFFIEDDPRVTRVGRVLRKLNLDELPQLLNVLAGQMSLVGPRPSPRHENRCCPAWREARLSMRPGITGLWQVKRARREGEGFQEWIRYDIEYVENYSLGLDLWILWRTLMMMVTPVLSGVRKTPSDPDRGVSAVPT